MKINIRRLQKQTNNLEDLSFVQTPTYAQVKQKCMEAFRLEKVACEFKLLTNVRERDSKDFEQSKNDKVEECILYLKPSKNVTIDDLVKCVSMFFSP